MNDYLKNALRFALDGAEAYAKETTNPIDDVIVAAAAGILRRIFKLGGE